MNERIKKEIDQVLPLVKQREVTYLQSTSGYLRLIKNTDGKIGIVGVGNSEYLKELALEIIAEFPEIELFG